MIRSISESLQAAAELVHGDHGVPLQDLLLGLGEGLVPLGEPGSTGKHGGANG